MVNKGLTQIGRLIQKFQSYEKKKYFFPPVRRGTKFLIFLIFSNKKLKIWSFWNGPKNLFFDQKFLLKNVTAFDQNWPVWSSININGQWYVAMSESGKSLDIDCWNINLYFKLFFRILASQKVRWPIYINRTSVVAHFK